MNARAEQRRHFRNPVFRPAQIVLSEKAPKLDCNAHDLSAQGVRLRFQQHTAFLMSSMSLSMESGSPVVPFGGPIQKWA